MGPRGGDAGGDDEDPTASNVGAPSNEGLMGECVGEYEYTGAFKWCGDGMLVADAACECKLAVVPKFGMCDGDDN